MSKAKKSYKSMDKTSAGQAQFLDQKREQHKKHLKDCFGPALMRGGRR